MIRASIFLLIFSSNILFGQQIIKNLQWSNIEHEIEELTAGYGLTLYAETENIDDGELVNITIWGKGEKNDDLVGEYISRVYDNKIMFHWTLIFERDKMQNNFYEIKEKGFTSPKYYFTVQYNRRKSDNSKLLDVMVWVRRLILDSGTNEAVINRGYVLLAPDDTEIRGFTDAEGYLREENIKVAGDFYIIITDDRNPDPIPPFQEPEKPVYYKVKENDSLWTIASYDFIYGDPYLWKILYENNRQNFIDENNPDLIDIGQTLIIPSLSNEIRNGTR